MEKTKLTKREVINAMLGNEVVSANEDWVAYLTNEITLLDKKSASKSVNKEKIVNDNLRNELVDFMSAYEKVSIADITNGFEALSGATSQRVSGLLSPMVKEGKVTRIKEGKNTFYSVNA